MSDPFKADPSKRAAAQVPCAICGKPQAAKFVPFCSARCADLDLGTWLKGGYVVPGAPEEAESAVESPTPQDEE